MIAQPLTVVSVGAGQDSTAIVYRIGNDPAFRARYAPGHVLAIMADTGDEHDETITHVARLKAFCASHAIEFVHLTFDMGFHSGPWAKGLAEFYRTKNAIGSQAYPKTCTDNLKVQPIYRYLAQYLAKFMGAAPSLAERKQSLYAYAARYGKLRVIIGIAAGEEKRVAKAMNTLPCRSCKGVGTMSYLVRGVYETLTCIRCKGKRVERDRSKWFAECVERVYPLIAEGMDRAACQAYIASVGEVVPPPSNCFMCPFKSPIEILWTARHDRARFDVWVALEARKLAANTAQGAKNFGVGKTKTLPMMLAAAEEKYEGWTDDALNEYRMSHGHCVKSVY